MYVSGKITVSEMPFNYCKWQYEMFELNNTLLRRNEETCRQMDYIHSVALQDGYVGK
jgi:hypothetical protein